MAIIGFMRGLANDVAKDGITCNAVLPGITDTPATAPMPDEARRATWQAQAIQRFARPEDIVGPVLFLIASLHRCRRAKFSEQAPPLIRTPVG